MSDSSQSASVALSGPVANADAGTALEPNFGIGNTTYYYHPTSVLANDVGTNLRVIEVKVGATTYAPGSGIPTTWGTLNMSNLGGWSYFVSDTNPAINRLKVGESLTETVSYTVRDSNGLTSTSTLTLTIAGRNDAPVVTLAPTPNLAEGSGVHRIAIWGSATSDAEGDALSLVNVGALPAGYSIDYENKVLVIDTNHPDYNSLRQGGGRSQRVDFGVSDGTATVNSYINTFIQGSNDKPQIAPFTATLTEGGAPITVDWRTIVSDPDIGDTLAFTQYQGGVAGGSYNATTGLITIDPSNAGWNFVGAGQTVTREVVIYVTDLTPSFATRLTFNVAVTGINDAPTAVADNGTARENGAAAGFNATGNVLTNDTDPDTGDTKTVTAFDLGGVAGVVGTEFKAAYGSLTLNANGTYTYIVDNTLAAVNGLKANQSLLETFNYTMSDGQGGTSSSTLRVTVQGANDLPQGSGPMTFTATSNDPHIRFSAFQGFIDAENDVLGVVNMPTSLPFPAYYDSNAKQIVITPGSYRNLKEGQSVTGAFTYGVTDAPNTFQPASVQQTVTFTIYGVNDAPTVGNKSATAYEGSTSWGSPPPVPTGNLLAGSYDWDQDPLSVVAFSGVNGAGVIGQALAGAYGFLTVNADGSYRYTVNDSLPAVDRLASGQIVTDTFSYTIADPGGLTATATLTVSLRGTNDPIRISAPSFSTPEAGALITWSALDGGVEPEGAPISVTPNSTNPPGLTYNSTTRTFTFDPNHPAYNPLAPGETYDLPIYYQLHDGFGAVQAKVIIRLSGINDAPVVTPQAAAAAIEGGDPVSLSALAGVADPEQLPLTVVPPAILPDGVSFAGGKFTLDPKNAAFDGLKAGEKRTVSVTYDVSDGEFTRSQTQSWTGTGVNDAPVATALTATVAEGAPALTLSALQGATDVDGDTLSVAGLPASLPAGLTYDAEARSFRFDPSDAAYDRLGAGASETLTVNFGVSDGAATTPQTLTLTVTGTNDAPVVTPQASAPVTEGGEAVSLIALAGVTDPEQQVLTVTPPAILPDGVSFGDGKFTLDPKNTAFDGLKAGETRTVSVSYDVSDGEFSRTQTQSWTVTGTNDAPTVAALGATVNEGGAPITLSALLGANDVDGDVLSVMNLPSALPAGLTYDSEARSFRFDPTNGAYDRLAAGASETLTVAFGVSDGAVTTPQTLSLTVNGANDAPTARPDASATEEKQSVVINLIGNDTDPDAGDALTLIAPATTSQGSSLEVVGGSVRFTPGAVFDLLGAGREAVETFSYVVRDASGAESTSTVSVTIRGVADGSDIGGTNKSDDLSGTAADERMIGGNGEDVLRGLGGADRLLGENGGDQLFGGAGFDLLDGGNGGDRLDGGAGDDTLVGGNGPDEFVFGRGYGRDVVTDFREEDVVRLSRSDFADFAAVRANAAQGAEGVVITLDASTTLTLRGVALSSLNAGDFLFG